MLLAVAAVEAVAWCIVLPPLQGPDEISHVAYVQRLVEGRELPWQPGGATGDPDAAVLDRAEDGRGDGRDVRALREPRRAAERHRRRRGAVGPGRARASDRAQRADGGFTSALKNPPAYYLYSGLVYAATSPLDLFDQLFLMRLANIPLLLAMVVFTWLLAGELLPGRRALQTLATAVVALQPQLIQLTANVNPDVLLAATSTAGLYLSVVILQRGLSAPRVAGLVALCVLAGFTHGRGLALVLPAVLALALRLWKDRRPDGRPVAVTAGALALGAVAFLAALVFVATNQSPDDDRGPAPVLVRVAVLPPAARVHVAPAGPAGLRDPRGDDRALLRRVRPARGAFPAPGSTTRCGPPWASWPSGRSPRSLVHRRAVAARWDVAVVLAAAVVGLLGLLHTVAYRSLLNDQADPIIAGRYLLPLAALFGIAVALAVSLIPRRWGAAAGGAVVATLALVQVAALGITLERFYA